MRNELKAAQAEADRAQQEALRIIDSRPLGEDGKRKIAEALRASAKARERLSALSAR